MRKLILLAVIVFTLTTLNFAQTSKPSKPKVILVGNGVADDTHALNEWGKGRTVYYKGKKLGRVLQDGKFSINWRIDFNRRGSIVRRNVFIWHYTGYNRINWVNYGRGVRRYRNTIIDMGSSELKLKLYNLRLEYTTLRLDRLERENERLQFLVVVQNKIIQLQRDNIRKEKERLKRATVFLSGISDLY